MNASPSLPGQPRGIGASAVERDLQLVQRASALITELGDDLDRRLATETVPSERLRCLRETTNRITRTANDAIQAYRRARRSLDVDVARGRDSAATALAMTRLLEARREVLAALDRAGSRYPAPQDRPEPAGPRADAGDSR